MFDDYVFDVSETEEDDILAELRRVVFMSVPTVAGAMYGFEFFGNGTKRHGPPQRTKVEAVKALQRELRNLKLNDLEWSIDQVAIRVMKPDASVGKGGRSFIQASKAWVIVSPNTNTNCAFSACVLSINRDTYRWLLEKGEKRLVERSADLKRYVNPSNKKRTHVDDLQAIADYKKTEIVLYNNVFHKIRRFEPSGEIGKKPNRKLNRRPIEIQLKENHFVALLRRAEVNEPWEAEVVVEEPETESKVIQVKRKKYFRPYDGKFVAWDLESTGNGKEDRVHVCYAMGLAWEDQYVSFWGLGSSIKPLNLNSLNGFLEHSKSSFSDTLEITKYKQLDVFHGCYDLPFKSYDCSSKRGCTEVIFLFIKFCEFTQSGGITIRWASSKNPNCYQFPLGSSLHEVFHRSSSFRR